MHTAELAPISSASALYACHLAEVVSVKDKENLGRVQVRLLNFDGVGAQDAPLWARVAVPFAGKDRGSFLLPDVGDEVLVAFVNGDARLPIVVGSLWNGKAKAPERLGGSGERIDRWTIKGKAGTRIAIVEERDGEATISFTTPGGVKGQLTDANGGKIEFVMGSTTITVDNKGVTVGKPAAVNVEGSQVSIKAPQVTVDAAMAKFSGVVQCQVLKATTVMGNTYLPGVGNVW